MPTITTATGKTYECTLFGIAQGLILVTKVIGLTIPEAYEVFSNAEETSVLTYRPQEDGSEDRVERNFTTFIGVENTFSREGELQIMLRKALAEEA